MKEGTKVLRKEGITDGKTVLLRKGGIKASRKDRRKVLREEGRTEDRKVGIKKPRKALRKDGLKEGWH
jgi:hypothetical protein